MKPFYFSAVWLPAKKQTPVVGKGLGIDLNVLFYKGHGVKIKEVTPFPPSLPTNPPNRIYRYDTGSGFPNLLESFVSIVCMMYDT